MLITDPPFSPEPFAALLLYDRAERRVLYEKNAGRRLPIASLAKIATALLALETFPDPDRTGLIMDRRFYDGLLSADASTAGFQDHIGKSFSVTEYLCGCMISSGSEAALCLADAAGGGSMEAFSRRMNGMLSRLGCVASRFDDPTGLSDDRNFSTAEDLCRLFDKALENTRFRRLISAVRRRAPGFAEPYFLRNRLTDPKSNSFSPYALGGKTGTTEAAGRCVCELFSRAGREYIAVLLGYPYINEYENLMAFFAQTRAFLFFGTGSEQSAERVHIDYHMPRAVPGQLITVIPKRPDGEPLPAGSFRVISSDPETAKILPDGRISVLRPGIARVSFVSGTGDYDLCYIDSTGEPDSDIFREDMLPQPG